jgi:L,D-transpeptidase ErfK/SrfK
MNPIAAAAVLVLAVGFAAPAAAADGVIGAVRTYVARAEDTLLDIGRDNDLGYVELRAANPGVDPWLPGAGTSIVLPLQFILPMAPHRGIVINLPELRLYYYPANGGPPRSFPLGIGGEGKETPVGRTQVAGKRSHPIWIPTASEHTDDPDLPTQVPPGPDNPMGDYALYLGWRGYAIHGTNKPYSIGRRDSHGCIRMYPEDIEFLFRHVAVGTPVTVVDQPAKVGRRGSDLYLEVHATQSDADALELEGHPRGPVAVDVDELAAKAAGRDAARLDWYAVDLAAAQRTGIPVRILQGNSGS